MFIYVVYGLCKISQVLNIISGHIYKILDNCICFRFNLDFGLYQYAHEFFIKSLLFVINY